MKKHITFLFLIAILNGFTQQTSINLSSNYSGANSCGGGALFSLELNNNFLYLNPGFEYLSVFDISDPTFPSYQDTHVYANNLPNQFAIHLDKQDNHLFAYGGPKRMFRIFDISNTDPITKGAIDLSSHIFNDFFDGAHIDKYSYLITNDSLVIINTENKNAPFVANTISYTGSSNVNLRNIYVTNQFIYLSTEDKILILDNSDQENPTYVSEINQTRQNFCIDFENHHLIAFSTSNMMQLYDISDAFNPVFVSEIPTTSPYYNIYIHNNILVQSELITMGDTEVSLLFYEIKNGQINLINEIYGGAQHDLTDVAFENNTIVASKFGGFEVYNIDYATNTIELSNNSKQARIYPNPCYAGIIYLDNIEAQTKYTILDIDGKEITSGIYSSNGININRLKKGTYLLKSFEGNHVNHLKFIKQ